MANQNESLVRRFWTHVFEKPNKPAVYVKNQAQTETYLFTGAMPPAHPVAVQVKAKPYRTLTWDDCGHLVAEFMAYLTNNGFKKGDRLAILAWNSPEWVWTDLAVQSLGGVTVPIYPNTSSEGVCEIINDSDAKFLLSDDVEQLRKADPQLLTTSQFHTALFSHALSSAPDYTGAKASPDAAYGYTTPLKFGDAAQRYFNAIQFKHIAYDGFATIDPNSLATIIYSSGSTGKQKGVPLTHGNIAAACQALLRHGFNFSAADTYLSYLPLAHVFERVNGQAMCLWNAVPTAFCRTDELGDTLPIVRPTILVGVPAVWRKVKDKITAELAHTTGIKAKMIAWAFDESENLSTFANLRRTIAQKLVFKTIRGKLGGRLRLLVSGGAAIHPDLLKFYNDLGLKLRQGYGMTETTGGIAAETDANSRRGSVGKLIDCVEIKFVVNDDNPNPKKQIIFLRGDCIIKTYHNLPAVNATSFDADGWLNTGDFGWMDEDGYLYITGRKKREGKTQQGKYYSPENIEIAFDGSPIVQYVVPIGDDKPFIGALIFVNHVTAKALLAKANVVIDDDSKLYSTPVIQQAVAEAVAKANSTLEHWDQVGQYEIVPVEASVANGLLTPTLKIRSERAMEKYDELITLIYSRKR
jgi:long-chain acyl-CoA synthetase